MGKISGLIPTYHQKNAYVVLGCELLHWYFEEQSMLLDNNSKLPTSFVTETKSLLTSFDFSLENIGSIIKNLDPNKAHEHDVIKIRILKLCGNSINEPLFFKLSL